MECTLINQQFDPSKAQIIKRTPLGQITTPDIIVWHYTPSRGFTAYSFIEWLWNHFKYKIMHKQHHLLHPNLVLNGLPCGNSISFHTLNDILEVSNLSSSHKNGTVALAYHKESKESMSVWCSKDIEMNNHLFF